MKKLLGLTKYAFSILAASTALLLEMQNAEAHARLRLGGTTPPRNNSAGLKSGPCGDLPRTTSPTILQAGQRLTLQIDEVIDHPGSYRIAFSRAGDSFPAPMPMPNASTSASDVLWVPYIADVPNVHAYEATITVPDTLCTDCSIQMIQYMTENNPPTMYYSCADIEIRRTAPSPTPTSTPTVTPSPAPMPACH